jgi:hypothetical protein
MRMTPEIIDKLAVTDIARMVASGQTVIARKVRGSAADNRKKVKAVYRYVNGNVIVFDYNGQQYGFSYVEFEYGSS